jgi:spermidine/putrescine transport system permease protein
VLSAGAIAEGKLLGGRSVITIGDDIETAFTFAQNWPLGSALSMSLIVILGGLVVAGLGRIDLDRIMGRR